MSSNIQRDIEKDRALENLGWRVIHFWGKDITKKTEQCVRVVEEVIFDVKMEQWQLSINLLTRNEYL